MLRWRRTTAEGTSSDIVDHLASGGIARGRWGTAASDTSQTTFADGGEVVAISAAAAVFKLSTFVAFAIVSESMENSGAISSLDGVIADIFGWCDF